MTDTLAVIFGGPSDEHDISILTGLQSSRILSNKYNILNTLYQFEWLNLEKSLIYHRFVTNSRWPLSWLILQWARIT